ncbi:serine protease DegS [Azomonas agilis]|uniref:Serine protease DegS n=1 Tax=Azomonas agilis TaxID=116849 RepID=A0A562J0V7_9GAMM|nr:trypsin-like peptidase domain-containing protein [Azomonas agilis]TWH76763.1 serine protease DegS [Azomonas agilis]
MLKTLRFFGWPIVTGLLAALLLIERYPQWVGLPERFSLLSTPKVYSYADAVERAMPAVVNLYTLKRNLNNTTPPTRQGSGDLSRQQRMESSLGSGVIMTAEGHILTNNHVIANAEQIIVALKDGRETQARLIGNDPETDLAVLKIDLPQLPVIRIGRSEEARTGDIALAIGNPFGVGQTVTLGIISATGRNHLGLNTYEDFIQTDAAINRGNSGGALVDALGNLIGINAAMILSGSGGSQGIGFAIPTAQALEVMQSIIQHGQVIRGWLGVEVQALTPALEAQLKKNQLQGGILIGSVYEQGPAERAGLRRGDILLAIDHIPSIDGRIAMNQVARARPGDMLQLEVLRGNNRLQLNAEVGIRPPLQTQ